MNRDRRAIGDLRGRFTVAEALTDLQRIDPKWTVELGNPGDLQGWIPGVGFQTTREGDFHSLLTRIGQRSHTSDRRTIAASFALRFGWTSFAAIAPSLIHGCVPDISLSNIALKFREDTFFERIAIYVPRGPIMNSDFTSPHSETEQIKDERFLLSELRAMLKRQTMPVIDALYGWSGFSKKGAWGQITSSWASQFISVYDHFESQPHVRNVVETFFQGDDEVNQMQPKLHAVTMGDVTHLFQRRASCCRYYLLPQGSLCASCPLVSQDDRLAKNRQWMKEQLEGKQKSKHSS